MAVTLPPTTPRRRKAIVFTEFRFRLESVDAAREAGYATVLLTKKPRLDAAEFFDEIIAFDLADRVRVDEVIAHLRATYIVKAVVTNYEQYVVQRSYIAEQLGVPTTSIYAACCTRNKLLQRHALAVMPENIDFIPVATLADAERAFRTLGRDVFLKSIAGAASRLVFHAASLAKLRRAWRYFRDTRDRLDGDDLYNDFSYLDFRFQYPSPREILLVERAAPGRQVTVDALMNHYKITQLPSMVDVYTAADFGRDDTYNACQMLPSRLPIDLQKEVKTVVETAAHVLGLRNCALHAELMVADDGTVKIIEIASRTGGYRPQLFREAFGVDVPRLFIEAVTNQIKLAKPTRQKYAGVVKCFAKRRGTFSHIRHFDELALDPAVRLVKQKATVGEHVGPACENFVNVAEFFVTGETYDAVLDRCRHYHDRLHVVIRGR